MWREEGYLLGRPHRVMLHYNKAYNLSYFGPSSNPVFPKIITQYPIVERYSLHHCPCPFTWEMDSSQILLTMILLQGMCREAEQAPRK